MDAHLPVAWLVLMETVSWHKRRSSEATRRRSTCFRTYFPLAPSCQWRPARPDWRHTLAVVTLTLAQPWTTTGVTSNQTLTRLTTGSRRPLCARSQQEQSLWLSTLSLSPGSSITFSLAIAANFTAKPRRASHSTQGRQQPPHHTYQVPPSTRRCSTKPYLLTSRLDSPAQLHRTMRYRLFKITPATPLSRPTIFLPTLNLK